MNEILYPIGEQSFPAIREGGYLYIDKTRFIPELLKNKYYYLSRPRRFGKSLLISTLEQFFLGRKDLFKGLEVYDYDWDWTSYPVIHIDLSNGSYSKKTGLQTRLHEILDKIEKNYDLPKYDDIDTRARFNHLIDALRRKFDRRVVILIDEYEKALLDSIFRPHHEEYKDELHDFYSVLKENSDNIRFLFITGVTRFGHLNIFSGLNNLKDISLDSRFSTICGITEEELTQNLREGAEDFSLKRGIDYSETISILKKNFDGYHFSEDLIDIYNPYSLLCSLDQRKIVFNWFESGSSSFLINLVKEKNYDLKDIDGIEVTAARLNTIEPSLKDPVPLLYQSGYLTIKAYDENDSLYTLGYPNLEVKKGVLEILIPLYLDRPEQSSNIPSSRIKNWLFNGEPEAMMEWLKGFFSRIPFEVNFKYEREFQFVIISIFNLIGLEDNVEIEKHTSKGSIDLIVSTERYVYIFEFKLRQPVEKALAQIKDKGYADIYRGLNKIVYGIGVEFDASHHNIEDYKIIKIEESGKSFPAIREGGREGKSER